MTEFAERLLREGCLDYTDDRPERVASAQRLLADRPDLAATDVFTMAATGAHHRLRTLLADQPELADRPGGPCDWQPLLYLCYSRLGDGPGRSAVETARLLLAAGADPNAGFLWNDLPSPFTALTGVLGGGEQDQPVHPDAARLARLLLEAGADPNDNQGLYNRMFSAADDHLELLFEFGLGAGLDSPWRRRLGHRYPSPTEMVTEQLRWAADHGLQHRVELLLRHQVDPDGRGYHPNYGDQTPYRLAVLAGFPVIAQLLAEAGADTSVVDEVDSFLGACLAGDEQRAADWAAADPSLPRRARERLPTAVAKAAENGRTGPVRLLLGYGFDPGVPERFGRTALHEAAHGGHTDLVRLLLEVGADPSVTDDRFRATPADWARHSGQLDIAELLSDAERKLGSR